MAIAQITPVQKPEPKKNKLETFMKVVDLGLGVANMAGKLAPKNKLKPASDALGFKKKSLADNINFGVDTNLR